MSEIRNEAKLQNTLQVPISKVEIQSSYAVLFSDGAKIGTIPISLVGAIILFDTAEQIIKNLNWKTILDKYKEEFAGLVKPAFPDIEIQVIPSTFGYIYVWNNNGDTIGYYKCAYNGATWNIYSAVR